MEVLIAERQTRVRFITVSIEIVSIKDSLTPPGEPGKAPLEQGKTLSRTRLAGFEGGQRGPSFGWNLVAAG